MFQGVTEGYMYSRCDKYGSMHLWDNWGFARKLTGQVEIPTDHIRVSVPDAVPAAVPKFWEIWVSLNSLSNHSFVEIVYVAALSNEPDTIIIANDGVPDSYNEKVSNV